MEARGNGPSYPNQYVTFFYSFSLPNVLIGYSPPANCITDLFSFLFQFDTNRGTNYVRGSLNWGPLTWLNAVYKTFGWWSLRRGSYDQDFHSYALEWDQDFMYVCYLSFFVCFTNLVFYKRRIYVDSRLHHMLDLTMNIPFFERGNFPGVVQNGSEAIILADPWSNGTKAAPFDQRKFSFSSWLPLSFPFFVHCTLDFSVLTNWFFYI